MSTRAVATPGGGARGVLDRAGAPGGRNREDGRCHQASVDRGLGQAADPVAAHLRLAPVRVVQLHGEVAPVASRPDPDDPVGPDAPVPVGQHAHLGRRQPDRVVGVEDDQEVVPGTLVLGGVHRPILAAGVPQPCTERAALHQLLGLGAALRPGDARVTAEPGRLAAGELARAPHRFLHAVRQGHPVLDMAEDLPVAEGLAGRA